MIISLERTRIRASPEPGQNRMQAFISLLVFLLIVHLVRNFLANRVTASPPPEAFEGELYLVDGSYVAKRHCRSTPTRTVICVPGFLEDMRYFFELYADQELELILLNNANYHCPVAINEIRTLSNPQANPFQPGTIAYDGYILNQIIQQLASTDNITVHGHSRGGAVVLEAGKQAPEITGRCHAILEAPVVPRGRLSRGNRKLLRYGGYYFVPILFSVLRVIPPALIRMSPLLRVSTPYKEKMICNLAFTPRQFSTAVINIRDIERWQTRNDVGLYKNYRTTTMLIGERDGILSRNSMLKSAQESTCVDVVETRGTDHFISVERPELVRAVFS